MTQPPDTPSLQLHEFLRREQERILREWEGINRQAIASARDISADELRNNLPVLLDDIAAHAEKHLQSASRITRLSGEGAKSHAEYRWQSGFSLEEITREPADDILISINPETEHTVESLTRIAARTGDVSKYSTNILLTSARGRSKYPPASASASIRRMARIRRHSSGMQTWPCIKPRHTGVATYGTTGDEQAMLCGGDCGATAENAGVSATIHGYTGNYSSLAVRVVHRLGLGRILDYDLDTAILQTSGLRVVGRHGPIHAHPRCRNPPR